MKGMLPIIFIVIMVSQVWCSCKHPMKRDSPKLKDTIVEHMHGFINVIDHAQHNIPLPISDSDTVINRPNGSVLIRPKSMTADANDFFYDYSNVKMPAPAVTNLTIGLTRDKDQDTVTLNRDIPFILKIGNRTWKVGEYGRWVREITKGKRNKPLQKLEGWPGYLIEPLNSGDYFTFPNNPLLLDTTGLREQMDSIIETFGTDTTHIKTESL